jgi:hypothetical protein
MVDEADLDQALTPDKLPAALPEPLRRWLGRLPSSVEEDRLAIRVEVSKADFESLDVAALTRMTEEMKKAAPDDEDALERYWQQQKKAAEEREKSRKP